MAAVIHIKNTGETIETNMTRSILIALQMQHVPIETICGGRAMCGRCVVRILNGAEFLSRMQPHEAHRLQAIGAEDDMRLACQTYTRGKVEIEIINFKPKRAAG